MYGHQLSLIDIAIVAFALALAVCVLAFVLFVPRIRGPGAIGLGYLLGFLSVVASIVVIVLAGARWTLS